MNKAKKVFGINKGRKMFCHIKVCLEAKSQRKGEFESISAQRKSRTKYDLTFNLSVLNHTLLLELLHGALKLSLCFCFLMRL